MSFVVDMRSRPAFLHRFFGAEPGTEAFEVVRWLNRRVGAHDIDHFTRGSDRKGFLAEMDSAGITAAVMVARSVPGVRVSNDDLAKVAAEAQSLQIGRSTDASGCSVGTTEAGSARWIRAGSSRARVRLRGDPPSPFVATPEQSSGVKTF